VIASSGRSAGVVDERGDDRVDVVGPHDRVPVVDIAVVLGRIAHPEEEVCPAGHDAHLRRIGHHERVVVVQDRVDVLGTGDKCEPVTKRDDRQRVTHNRKNRDQVPLEPRRCCALHRPCPSPNLSMPTIIRKHGPQPPKRLSAALTFVASLGVSIAVPSSRRIRLASV
jgi:hypothetical protein